MRRVLALGLIVLLAGCVFPGFDYNTTAQYPVELETDSMHVFAVPNSVHIGQQLVVYANYSYGGMVIESATCIMEFESMQSGMTYSAQGYQGNVDTGGMDAGTYSVGVRCSKPGYKKREGGVSFSVGNP